MTNFEKEKKRLQNHWPLVGKLIRRKACVRLAAQPVVEAVPLLAGALRDADEQVRNTAASALRSLRSQAPIDALCDLWVTGRARELGSIIAEKQYVAAQSVQVRVLSALKAKRLEIAGESATAIPVLVGAFNDDEVGIAQAARAAAGALQNTEAIGAFCSLWAQDRKPALGEIIVAKRYVAAKPPDLRALSALKARETKLLVNNPELLEAVVPALEDPDSVVSSTAEETLLATSAPRLVDRLCALASGNPKGRLARLCVASGKQPSAPEDRALFLFVTGQLDAYFEDDHEFESLRPAYERASQNIKDVVLEVARSGDRRAAEFFPKAIGATKRLTECGEREILHGIEVAVRDRNWPELFRMFTQMPLRYGYPLLEDFRASGWEPDDEEKRTLWHEVLRESSAGHGAAQEPDKQTSSLFGRWLAEGRAGSSESESALAKRLENAAPPDGVRTVAALSAQRGISPATRSAVEKHQHWLVRLAGYASGLAPNAFVAKDDPVYWVREVAGAGAALDFWPVKAKPDDIENLDAVPREVWVGKAGQVRQVLRLLMAYRMTLLDVAELEIVADESAVDIEDVV